MKIDLANSGTICIKRQKDKIMQKDAEIERLERECNRLAKAASKNYRDNGLSINEEFYRQAERIKELESEILEQCRINGIGAEREASLLGKVERQSAALKLAKEVLEDAHQNINPERGYADEIESDIEKTIAAINEVLGE